MVKKINNNLKEDNSIIIRGARQHNLKNIDLSLPRNKFIVFTGVSGVLNANHIDHSIGTWGGYFGTQSAQELAATASYTARRDYA